MTLSRRSLVGAALALPNAIPVLAQPTKSPQVSADGFWQAFMQSDIIYWWIPTGFNNLHNNPNIHIVVAAALESTQGIIQANIFLGLKPGSRKFELDVDLFDSGYICHPVTSQNPWRYNDYKSFELTLTDRVQVFSAGDATARSNRDNFAILEPSGDTPRSAAYVCNRTSLWPKANERVEYPIPTSCRAQNSTTAAQDDPQVRANETIFSAALVGQLANYSQQLLGHATEFAFSSAQNGTPRGLANQLDSLLKIRSEQFGNGGYARLQAIRRTRQAELIRSLGL